MFAQLPGQRRKECSNTGAGAGENTAQVYNGSGLAGKEVSFLIDYNHPLPTDFCAINLTWLLKSGNCAGHRWISALGNHRVLNCPATTREARVQGRGKFPEQAPQRPLFSIVTVPAGMAGGDGTIPFYIVTLTL